MNKTRQRLFLILFSLLPVFSCIRDFDLVDDSGLEKEIVVNGILVGDSIPVVYLHRSSSVRAGDAFEPIKNASVMLYYKPKGAPDDGLRGERLLFRDSCYKSDLNLPFGHEYRLEVQMADGSVLEASTSVPEPVGIGSTRLVFPAGTVKTPLYSGVFSRLEVNIDAGQSDGNSYFEVYNYSRDTIHRTDRQWSHTFFRTWNNDGLILREAPPDGENHAFLFRLGAGDSRALSLSFDFIGMESNPFFSEFYPVLNTVSEEYFLYKKSLYSHLESLSFRGEFDLDDLYVPSIFKMLQPVYSNIKGGKGIFAGLASDKMKTTCNVVGYACQ